MALWYLLSRLGPGLKADGKQHGYKYKRLIASGHVLLLLLVEIMGV
jgi:hypothetical protein